MYFSPSKRKKSGPDNHKEEQILYINGRVIQHVQQTKFLGVIIDDKLSWGPHIASLNQKLRSICGRIHRIRKCLPESLYEQLYHSLFESHLGFGISVWGGVPDTQLQSLFVTQKKCIRILFGDYKSYVNKFETCARSRPIHSQCMGSSFYKKESTKPLFTKHELLTVQNLYRYRCILEFFKIMKYRVPISIYELFVRSDRKETYMITPRPTHQFAYNSAWQWNEFRKIIGLLDFSSPINSIKNLLMKSLRTTQGLGGNEWSNLNFSGFCI